jgi:hypothetical protein
MKLTFKVVNQISNITIFDLIVFWGLVEDAEKGNIERKTLKMNFFCAINSNDKKIFYLINDKKKDN